MDINNLNIEELSDSIRGTAAAESKKSTLRADDLKLKLKHVEPLCSAVVERIRVILSSLDNEAPAEEKLQYLATNVSALATTIAAEPANVRSQITAALATAEAWKNAGPKIDDVVVGLIQKNSKIAEMASAMKDGHNYDSRRKIGERPESLKSIRQAKKLLEEQTGDD